nr:hypothetical protein [Tanacetum cinerariifolium]
MATTIEQQVALDETLAFLVTENVPAIYIQELWATATVHQHSIRFKMDTKKHIVELEAFREMLHISPRVPGQSFAELPFEEKILEFLSLRLPQAQILWGLYHKRNVDYAFLIWEDLVYQVEHKIQKKSNEMYYPRFTKVIIPHFMTKKPSIPRQNKVNWHYVRDDILFSTIKVVSRHQNTQQYGAILPIELTTEEIRNTKAYKEYYACATGEAAPKPKASARKKKGVSASSTTPPTPIATPTPTTTVVAALRLSAATKGKQHARATSPTDPLDVERTEAEQLKIVLRRSRHETHISQQGGFGTYEGTGSKPEVPDVPSDDPDEEISWNSFDDEDVDAQGKDRDDNEANKNDESNDRQDDDDDQYETKMQESSSVSSFMTSMLNPISDAGVEFIFTTTSSPIAPIQTSTPIMTPSTIATITTSSEAPIPPTTILSVVLQNLPTFDLVFRFEDKVKIEESVNVQLEAEVLTRSSHSSRTSYVVAADLTEIELKKILNEKMEGNKSSHSSRTSYVVAADLTEIELKKILIEKMEGNKKDPSMDQTEGQRDEEKMSASESTFAEEPVQTTCKMDEPPHLVFETDNQGRRVILFAHFINNDLEYLHEGASSKKYTTSVTKTKAAYYGHIKWIEDLGRKRQQFYGFAVNQESALDVYSKRRIIAVTELKIVEWHNYKHLDWISVRRDDDKIYKFIEGDFKRLRLQDIEDMLLLLVQGKLSNLTVEERFAFNVSLRMFTRSIVIQRRVEDLQLGVKIYQKRLNLTKPDTYQSDLKRREAYTAYSNQRGFIYQNKDKKNRLMRIDELHKFSDETLNDVCNALDDRLKGIRMQYLPQTIWRKGDKD